jgi:hypothetical protein
VCLIEIHCSETNKQINMLFIIINYGSASLPTILGILSRGQFAKADGDGKEEILVPVVLQIEAPFSPAKNSSKITWCLDGL